MTEMEAIERETADAFLALYNAQHGTSYAVTAYSDAPDVRCADPSGSTFNLEITLTEDRPHDIQALLGRSDHRSVETLRAHVDRVNAGLADPRERVSELGANVAAALIGRIHAKILKRYGPDTALVIRDVSPLDWDWDLEIPNMRAALADSPIPFDRGIWIINTQKTRIFSVL
jgi:hypothetical protein